jgi:hypothetical protein
MHGLNAHATKLKNLTPNFVEGVVSMMYLMSYVEFCMTVSRDGSISYDLSQLLKRTVIASFFPLHNLL